MATVLSIDLIGSDPAVRRGRPHILGTRVTVSDIVTVMVYHRQDADGLAAWFGLSLPQVYAALAYYYSHRAEMDAAVRAEIAQGEAIKAKYGSNPHPLLPR